MKRSAVLLLCLVGVGAAATPAKSRRPMEVDDLFRFKRVTDPQISPDGKTVAYVVTTVDVGKNNSSSSIWLAPTAGGTPRQLTNPTKKDRHPRWSPNGKHLLLESNRSGQDQLWVIDVKGGEARQLTTIASEAGNGIWSPDGKSIAFVSAVYPEYSTKPYAESDALNRKRKDETEKSPVKAKVFTRLFFRHWDEYVEDKRQHLFVMPWGDGRGGEPRDVTPGDRDAYPTSTTFSVGDDFTFSPDSKYVVFTAAPERNEAWSTNYDICRVPSSGGTTKWECLTRDNPAADGAPRFSPSGKLLAYRRQKKAGFEADRWDIAVVPCDASGAVRGSPTPWAPPRWDDSVEEFTFGPVLSSGLPFSFVLAADHRGQRPLFVFRDEGDVVQPALGLAGTVGSLSSSRDGKLCAYTVARLDAPAEVYMTNLVEVFNKEGTGTVRLTHHNDALLAQLERPRPESVTVAGAGGTPMQMWVLKPPGFDRKKKWPLAFLVHGGPQGAWDDGWSYRWNPELWVAQGYVVALPNPRGSTGFGQKYVDEISGDWGGKCYEDLMAGLAWLEKQPYIDPERMAAAGASFGGYMMNWFQGHTTKFKTLITHCGVYNFDSMYALTDELWFDEWEHGGPPWGPNRASYQKHSPHRFARNFKTPMLIIHNDLDFRVPVAEGLQLFTTLQRLGVPSRMINFPDEGHWVLKPANTRYWHREVFAWLAKYAPPGGR
jgi:dipeptidyl aminopeptidase/acylaminoacyl peptidase